MKPVEHLEFDWSGQKGFESRKEGIERALKKQDECYKMLYRCAVLWVLEERVVGEEFKGEDVHAYVKYFIGRPRKPQVMSGMWDALIIAGWVENIQAPSVNCRVNPKNKGCRRDLYRRGRGMRG